MELEKRPSLINHRARRALQLTVLFAGMGVVSLWASYALVAEFQFDGGQWEAFKRALPWVVGVKLLALVATRQMTTLVGYFGLQDLVSLIYGGVGAALVLGGLGWTGVVEALPSAAILMVDFLIFLALQCGLRVAARMVRERSLLGSDVSRRPEPVVIVGAGEAGVMLVRALRAAPGRGFLPLAFLDDDTNKLGRYLLGVCVEGRPEDFPNVPTLRGVRRAIIAMPSVSRKRVREIALFLRSQNLAVETVPALEDIVAGRERVSSTRPLQIEDLLGRAVIETDLSLIGGCVGGKRVLVTGAGGSIGSELCRQIARLGPARLYVLDQSEPALFTIEQELISSGYGGLILPMVGDVLDEARMDQIFTRHQPQAVFHAAAHKHVFLMERQPAEAVKNNSMASRNLADLAIRHGAETFVLVSTDKAINPTNVMGASKRLAEIHLQALHQRHFAGREKPATRLIAVRFGNVLGSSGSVIPIFKRQIEAGGPVTVTHPDVTRYFMTIPEAVGLVLQASAMGTGGEIFVLDMGQPMKIVDLARSMIELSGHRVGEDIEITFTGLKPGEKLFEELQHTSERHLPTGHPRIFRFRSDIDCVSVSEAARADLEPGLDALEPNEVKHRLKALIAEYQPHLD